MKKFSIYLMYTLMAGALLLNTSCQKNEDDAPPEENEEEIITDVLLTFTPEGGGTAITATAEDPDGEGVQDLEVTKDIELVPNTTYTLTLTLENSIEMEDITEEVETEGAEHMLFFAFTDGAFGDPSGDGNIDNRVDAINYGDTDKNGLPIGLTTTWTTGNAVSDADFRIVLKHQPDVKTASSGSTDGSTDLDLSWKLTVQ
ncbi:MAG: hypothetical protein KTR30_34195 [Saprospiraceae bacterium]|nr:hypothetical protein [Saprospiraceae bacterium]